MSPSRRILCPSFLVVLAALGCLGSTVASATPEGAPDPTFAEGGLFSASSGPFPIYQARAGAELPNGDLAVVGALDIGSPSSFDVLFISEDGDTLTECANSVPFMATWEGRAVAVDRDGQGVVGGVATFTGSSQKLPLVARLQRGTTCSFDTSWSGNGWQLLATESFCDTEDCWIADLAVSPAFAPRTFALVESRVNLLVSRLFVVAFHDNGSVDLGFGTNGFAEVTAPGLGTLAGGNARLAVDGRGRPLVLASRYDSDVGLDADPFLARFELDGDLDSTYGEGGVRVLEDDDARDSFPADLEVGADGVVVCGINTTEDTSYVFWLRDDGAVVTSGGAAGRQVGGLAVQGDGKVLELINLTDSDAMEIRRVMVLSPSSGVFALDLTFGNSGSYPLDVDLGGANGQQALALFLSTGRPLLLGRADGASGAGLFAMRLESRYVFADGFEIGTKAFWGR